LIVGQEALDVDHTPVDLDDEDDVIEEVNFSELEISDRDDELED
jgi:hypothetical protein